MALKNKVGALTRKYGYTWTAYGVALFAFPPAAFLIAWKLRRPLVVRLLAMLPPAAMAAAGPVVIGAAVAALARLFRA